MKHPAFRIRGVLRLTQALQKLPGRALSFTHHASRIRSHLPRALPITFHASRFKPRVLRLARPSAPGLRPSTLDSRPSSGAFTLIEMLVVIAIMGLLAAIAVPTFNSFKPSALAAATQKLLTDVGRARQLAISHRTTVCMVFVPTNFWTDPAFESLLPAEKDKARPLWDKQLIAYNFVSLRSIGDQPGRATARYLDEWKTLPEGAFIPLQKFFPKTPIPTYTISSNGNLVFQVFGFRTTNLIPFPSETAPANSGHWTTLPYIAFNYLGQLVDVNGTPAGENEFIPLAKGNVLFPRDPNTKAPQPGLPTISEVPVGNGSNAYNLVRLDWLTGRPRVERMEVR